MRIRRVLLALIVSFAGLMAVPTAAQATTEFTNHVVWGPDYSHTGWYFHQYRNQRGPAVIYSSNGAYDFVVQANGDLSTSHHWSANNYPGCGNISGCWYAYWRSHTDSSGVYFYMQTNGELVEYDANFKILWRSGKHPGTTYNYALVLTDTGNLIEYYSTGSPLSRTNRHIAWQTNRAPGAVRKCGGGAIDSGITSFNPLLAWESDISASVHNAHPLVGIIVTVYRYDGSNYNPVTHWVGPGSTVKYDAIWEEGINYPHRITMRTNTSADSSLLAAAASFYGHCWYVA